MRFPVLLLFVAVGTLTLAATVSASKDDAPRNSHFSLRVHRILRKAETARSTRTKPKRSFRGLRAKADKKKRRSRSTSISRTTASKPSTSTSTARSNRKPPVSKPAHTSSAPQQGYNSDDFYIPAVPKQRSCNPYRFSGGNTPKNVCWQQVGVSSLLDNAKCTTKDITARMDKITRSRTSMAERCEVHATLAKCPNDRYRALKLKLALHAKRDSDLWGKWAMKYWNGLHLTLKDPITRRWDEYQPFVTVNMRNSLACWLSYIRGEQYAKWLGNFGSENGMKMFSKMMDCAGDELFVCKELGEAILAAWLDRMRGGTNTVRSAFGWVLDLEEPSGSIEDYAEREANKHGKGLMKSMRKAILKKAGKRANLGVKAYSLVWDSILKWVDSKADRQGANQLDYWFGIKYSPDPGSILRGPLKEADARAKHLQKKAGRPQVGILPKGWTVESAAARCPALFYHRCHCYSSKEGLKNKFAEKNQACAWMYENQYPVHFKDDYPKQDADLTNWITFKNSVSDYERAKARLSHYVQKLRKDSHLRLMVAGYCSFPEPSDGYNMALSGRRAQLVYNMLEGWGAKKSQLSTRDVLPNGDKCERFKMKKKRRTRRGKEWTDIISQGVFKCGHMYATSDEAASRKTEIFLIRDQF